MKALKLFFGGMFFFIPVNGALADRGEIREVVEQLEKQHENLSNQIEKLKKLLGEFPEIDKMHLLEATEDMKETVRLHLEEGVKSYLKSDYEEAKESLQEAWEENPDNYVLNYNLGMAYYKLGKIALAKKMLKVALEENPEIEGKEEIKGFIEGKKREEKKVFLFSEEEKKLRTDIINLKKKVDSYIKSNTLSHPNKMKLVFNIVKEIFDKSEGKNKLIREFYLSLVDLLASYEMYGKALDTLEQYERSMYGKVLPDEYHSKKLFIERKFSEKNESLKAYRGYSVDANGDIKSKLSRDLHELEIFGAQMEEFVQEAKEGDENFDIICKRLGEYHWGNLPGRHVIVVNRFQELLYSSPLGTLPLDRYRDVDGKTFLKDITCLYESSDDFLPKRNVEFFPIDLSLKGEVVPYVVMYAYIPKHASFIIVRLPRKDLT